MNKNGVKLLAAIMVFAMAFTAFAVVSDEYDADETTDEMTYAEVQEKLNGEDSTVTLSSDITVPEDKTLDINGKTLDVGIYTIIMSEGSEIVGNDGTIRADGSIYFVDESNAVNPVVNCIQKDGVQYNEHKGVDISDVTFELYSNGSEGKDRVILNYGYGYAAGTISNVTFEVDDNCRVNGYFYALQSNSEAGTGLTITGTTLNGGILKVPINSKTTISNMEDEVILNFAYGTKTMGDFSVVNSEVSTTIFGWAIPSKDGPAAASVDMTINKTIDLGNIVIGGGSDSTSTFKLTIEGDGTNVTAYGGEGIDDLTIGNMASFTVPAGKTLVCDGTLTNDGTINNNGTISAAKMEGSGEVEGNPVSSITSSENALGLNQNLDSPLTIVTKAFLEKDLTIDAGVTLTIASNATLDLNGYTLTVNGKLVVENAGSITSGTIKEGTILLSKTGSIENNGLIGKTDLSKGVIIGLVQGSGSDVYTPGTVTVTNAYGVGFTINKTVDDDVVYTLAVSGDVSKKGNVSGKVEITSGTVAVQDSLSIGNGITLTIDDEAYLALTKGSSLEITSRGAMGGDGSLMMISGSIVKLNGPSSANIIAATGYEVASDSSKDRLGVTKVALSNVKGVVLQATEQSYYSDYIDGVKIDATVTEYRLLMSEKLEIGQAKDNDDNQLYASMTISKADDGNAYYYGIFVQDTLSIKDSFKSDDVPTIALNDAYITVLGTVTYTENNIVFDEETETNVIGAFYSVESTEAGGYDTYYIKPFEAALAEIGEAVDNTIYVHGPVVITSEVTVNADQIISGDGAYTIASTGKLILENDSMFEASSIDVEGILVAMCDSSLTVPADKFKYDVSSKDVDDNVTYSGFIVALNNAKDGDVIEITSNAEATESFTVPAGVTLKITSTGSLTAQKDVTVNGTLINEGAFTVKGKFTVAGSADLTEGTTNSLGGNITVSGEIVTLRTVDSGMNAVYYRNSDGYYVYTTLSKAAEAIGAMDVGRTLTQVGTVSDSSAVSLPENTVLSVNGTAVFGTIDLGKNAQIIVAGKLSASIVGQFGADGSSVDSTVVVKEVEKFSITSNTRLNSENIAIWYTKFNSTAVDTLANDLIGKVAVSTGTVEIENLNIDDADTLDIASGATVVISGTVSASEDNSKVSMNVEGVLIVNGTLNVSGIVNVPGTLTVVKNGNSAAEVNVTGTLNITGTLEVSEEENIEGTVTVGSDPASGGTIAVGDKPSTLGQSGTVIGPIGFEGTGYVKAYPGSDISAAKLDWNDVSGESEAVSTAFHINGVLYMTVYAAGSVNIDNGFLESEGFKITGMELVYETADGTLVDIENIGSWYTDAEMTKPASDGSVGNPEDLYFKAIASEVKVKVSVGTGISLYIDGIKYSSGAEPFLSVGTHNVTAVVDPGYKGEVTVSFNGQAITGGTFTITPEMASNAYEGTISVSATGAISIDSGVVTTSGDDGMGLTDYLLIILVVLIAIMAIIVALRLTRS